MTFDEAVSFANETGWYIHQLWQDDILTFWGCTLREVNGGYRRQISNGNGSSPEEAIFNAISNGSEIESAVNAASALGIVNDRPNILALIGAAKPQPSVTRRR